MEDRTIRFCHTDIENFNTFAYFYNTSVFFIALLEYFCHFYSRYKFFFSAVYIIIRECINCLQQYNKKKG